MQHFAQAFVFRVTRCPGPELRDRAEKSRRGIGRKCNAWVCFSCIRGAWFPSGRDKTVLCAGQSLKETIRSFAMRTFTGVVAMLAVLAVAGSAMGQGCASCGGGVVGSAPAACAAPCGDLVPGCCEGCPGRWAHVWDGYCGHHGCCGLGACGFGGCGGCGCHFGNGRAFSCGSCCTPCGGCCEPACGGCCKVREWVGCPTPSCGCAAPSCGCASCN